MAVPLEPIRDQELVEETLKNAQKYAYIVERYSPRLFRYVQRLGCRNTQDTHDVLQEVFIKAYLNLRGYDRDLPFSSWIYRICHNETMSWFRKQRVRPQPFAREEDLILFENIPAAHDLLEEFDQAAQRESMGELLAELDEETRSLLILRFYEEKSYEEISDILKCPAGTVATRLHRAKAMLKKRIQAKR